MIRVMPPDDTSLCDDVRLSELTALYRTILIRRIDGATITAPYPVPFGVITPAAATSVAKIRVNRAVYGLPPQPCRRQKRQSLREARMTEDFSVEVDGEGPTDRVLSLFNDPQSPYF